MSDNKPFTGKIIFEPGCFDNFEGSQEDLDAFVEEIKSMFEGKTEEEIRAMSRPVDMDELMEEDPELAAKYMKHLDQTKPTLH